MNKGIWLLKVFKTVSLVLVLGVSVTGCADTFSWQEEVKLSDGRVIKVTQKRRYEGAYDGQGYGAVPREAWLTFKLPEFGNQDITWHENLNTQILNVHDGKLYVVGFHPTCLEFDLYGKSNPPYVGFQYINGQWVRIPFIEIPEAIYDSNMWIDAAPTNKSNYVSLQDKAKALSRPTLSKGFKKIVPTLKSNCA